MKNLTNFISEKLHVGNYKKNHRDEQFYEKTSTDLLTEVQNEVDKDGEYHTYSYQDGTKKFKMGFIYYNKYDEFVGIQGFNTAKDFENMMGATSGMYEELGHLRIGEDTEIQDTKYIRIW